MSLARGMQEKKIWKCKWHANIYLKVISLFLLLSVQKLSGQSGSVFFKPPTPSQHLRPWVMLTGNPSIMMVVKTNSSKPFAPHSRGYLILWFQGHCRKRQRMIMKNPLMSRRCSHILKQKDTKADWKSCLLWHPAVCPLNPHLVQHNTSLCTTGCSAAS